MLRDRQPTSHARPGAPAPTTTGASSRAVPEVIAATKVQPPPPPSRMVARSGLLDRLVQSSDQEVVLLSAPAGSGKTTLLVQWSADEREERPFAWLSLDPEDNDPVRFWSCVVEALRTIEPRVGESAIAALRSPRSDLLATVLPRLINELAELERPLVFVIDDFHLLTDPPIHESMRFLIERSPPPLHLTIAARVDPPLALPRLRARRRLIEIRAADLRFSDAEAAAMLGGFGLKLKDEEIARLQSRTEGWAAGVQLAGLTLREQPVPEAFIASFAGDDRQIVDYLWSEVLEGQPPELIEFMLASSVLDRLTAPLCAAVTGDPHAADRLAELDHANLFTIALDNSRDWYRYHHLFRQLLRAQLAREHPERVPELNRRAAVWYRDHDAIPEAIQHALAAGATELATALIAANWARFFNAGLFTTVTGWLDALPAEVVLDKPELWLARIWTAMGLGHLAEAEAWLERGRDDRDPGRVKWAEVLHTVHLFKAGDVGGARSEIDAIDLDEEAVSPFAGTIGHCIRGAAAHWSGDPEAADAALREAVGRAAADGNGLAGVYALGYLALIAAEHGREAEAGRLLVDVDRLLAADPQLDQQFIGGVPHLARARASLGRGALAEAESESERALELILRGVGNPELLTALALRAEACAARGQGERARELLTEADEVLARCADPRRTSELPARVKRLVASSASAAQPSGHREQELSERELAVLLLLPSELTLREIGAELYVSLNTVKTHVRHIYAKLEAGGRDEAVSRARELDLIP